MAHLWEVDHPYYGAEGYPNECESFAELRADIDALSPSMNHVYRFDWIDWSRPEHDDVFLEGEERAKQDLMVFIVMPRKGQVASFKCPVTHDQEAEVLEWLRGPRVLGALRTLWEPLLDVPAGGEG